MQGVRSKSVFQPKRKCNFCLLDCSEEANASQISFVF